MGAGFHISFITTEERLARRRGRKGRPLAGQWRMPSVSSRPGLGLNVERSKTMAAFCSSSLVMCELNVQERSQVNAGHVTVGYFLLN